MMPDEKNDSLELSEQFISTSKEIDVEQIMTAIQKRIREKKETGILKQSEIDEISDMELLPLPDFNDVPKVYEPHLYPGVQPGPALKNEFHPMEASFEKEGGTGIRGIIKKILGKIRKIFFPFVRFMARPVYNELKQLIIDLHNENSYKLFELEHYKKTENRNKEYIILLHHTVNNLIAEASKSKIEQELQKTRIKVLEDKIEFLENRERAVEKKIFQAPGSPGEGDISIISKTSGK
jgi:hypothetical protein